MRKRKLTSAAPMLGLTGEEEVTWASLGAALGPVELRDLRERKERR
jgi:hypothetical protein